MLQPPRRTRPHRLKLPNIRSTESNQMSMSRIFLQSVSLCLLFVKSSLFLKSPDYLFEESRLFVQSSGSECTVYMCLLFVRSVSLRLKSLALLRAAIKSYSKLVLYSPKTGNIFSEKKNMIFLAPWESDTKIFGKGENVSNKWLRLLGK